MKSLNVVLLISILLPAAHLRAQAAGASLDSGILYEETTTSKVESFPTSNTMMRSRRIETPRGMRTETLERTGMKMPSSIPFAPSTDRYNLALADGRHFTIDTVRKEYYEVDVNKLTAKGSPLSSMMSSMNMKMTDSRMDAEDAGDGEVILGHPTSHWKIHATMTMTMIVNGDSVANTSEEFSDSYFSRDVKHVFNAVAKAGDRPDSTILSLASSLIGDSATFAAVAKKLPKTIPLKRVEKISMMMGPMDVLSTITVEVTRIEQRSFDPSLFEIPKGYKKVEMPIPASPIHDM
jgi:hypothetical protein